MPKCTRFTYLLWDGHWTVMSSAINSSRLLQAVVAILRLKFLQFVDLCGWFPKLSSLFLVQRYTFGKIVTKICSVVFTWSC